MFQMEVARMCMLYRCPAKKQSVIGYGYNYAAPFGESILYPNENYPSNVIGIDFETKSASFRKNFVAHGFAWPYFKPGQSPWNVNDGPCYKPFSCYQRGEPAPIPILWYGQSAHFGVLTSPSEQIAVCDTGLVINDPVVFEYNSSTGSYDEEGHHDPPDWQEHTSGLAAVNWAGYTRYPISRVYTHGTPTRKLYRARYCDHTTDPDGNKETQRNAAWRPVPRHNGKTCSLFFDGSVSALDIGKIVSHQWGERGCLFDNMPPHRPPAPKYEHPYMETVIPIPGNPITITTNPLPEREIDGTPK
jgi:hypothetical protein